jgi:hypothetical protein
MKKLFTTVLIALASITFASNIYAQSEWRETTTETVPSSNPESRLNTEGIEISSKNGNIIVKLPQKAQVKVFTILGQLVSQAELNAGTSMLKINSRGIYIVKVGNVTQKVAI